MKSISAKNYLTKFNNWIKNYEDVIGLTEVNRAQTRVMQLEKDFIATQIQRRNQQHELKKVQGELRKVTAEREKLSRLDERYLDILTTEHATLRQENILADALGDIEKTERDKFTLLSTALRESHETERTQAERTKYWSLIGSVVGVLIGVFGSTVNNYYRTKELRRMVNDANFGRSYDQLSETLEKQSSQLSSLLSSLKVYQTNNAINSEKVTRSVENLVNLVKRSNERISSEMSSIKDSDQVAGSSYDSNLDRPGDMLVRGRKLLDVEGAPDVVDMGGTSSNVDDKKNYAPIVNTQIGESDNTQMGNDTLKIDSYFNSDASGPREEYINTWNTESSIETAFLVIVLSLLFI